MGTKFRPRIPLPDVDSMPDAFGADIRPGHISTYEQRVLSNIGDVRWVQWYHRTLCDESGNIREIQSVGRDISGQREKEKEILMNSCEFASSERAIMLWNLTGEIIYANKAFIRMFGYAGPLEVLGRPLEQFIYPAGSETNIQQIATTLVQQGHWDGVFPGTIRKDGSVFNAACYMNMISDDRYLPQGGGIGVFIECTRQATETREEVDENEPTHGTGNRGVAIVDHSGIITYVDTVFLEITGSRDESAFLGKQAKSVLVPARSQAKKFGEYLEDRNTTSEWQGERGNHAYQWPLCPSQYFGEKNT